MHAYDNVNDMVIWNVVVNHIPKLKEEVIQLLN
ncbi:HepT-like ribonuclease domain-containing protein [Pedobacter segetis]|nr:HepT-like ribonuclease domain-containing protein [Pedobacter segetis]